MVAEPMLSGSVETLHTHVAVAGREKDDLRKSCVKLDGECYANACQRMRRCALPLGMVARRTRTEYTLGEARRYTRSAPGVALHVLADYCVSRSSARLLTCVVYRVYGFETCVCCVHVAVCVRGLDHARDAPARGETVSRHRDNPVKSRHHSRPSQQSDHVIKQSSQITSHPHRTRGCNVG